MAETVEQMPELPADTGKYPWSTWLDGQVWKLVPGTDFTCGISTMHGNVKMASWSRGIPVTVRRRDNCIYVQAHLVT